MNIALEAGQIVGMKLVTDTSDGGERYAVLVTFRVPLSVRPQIVEGVPISDKILQIGQLEAEIPETDKLAIKRSRRPAPKKTVLEILKCVENNYPVRIAEVSAETGFGHSTINMVLSELRRTGKIIAYLVRNVETRSGGNTTVYAPAHAELDPSKYAKKALFGGCRPTAKAEVLAYLEKIQRPATSIELEKYLIMSPKTVKPALNQLIDEGRVKRIVLDGAHGNRREYCIVTEHQSETDRIIHRIRKWVAENALALMNLPMCPHTQTFLLNNPFIVDKDGKNYVFFPSKVFQNLVGHAVPISDIVLGLLEIGIALTTVSGKPVQCKHVVVRKKKSIHVAGYGVLIEDIVTPKREEKDGTGKTK